MGLLRVRGAALVALAGVLAGCTAAPAAEPPPDSEPQVLESAAPELLAYYQQRIDWRGCGGGFECGSLRVPRDYGDPAGGDFDLALLRLTTDPNGRQGSLVVNPGGPGASGVEYARAALAIVGDDVRDAFDIVGFDPRGVGGSQPVECVTDPELDALLEVDPTPDSPAEVELLLTAAAGLGLGCQTRSADVAPWLDTVSTARDLDVLRAALGDQQLQYLGKSFGSAIGAVYAEQFPDRVGRLVLDGAFPVSLDSRQISQGQAVGFENALRRFVADCLAGDECPLESGTVPAGVAEIRAFLTALDRRPLPTSRERELTEALGSTAVLYHLYFPPGDWQLLRLGLAAGFAGDGTVLLDMLDQRLRRDPESGAFDDNSQEAFYAVSCLDRPVGGVEELSERASAWSQEAPTFGPYLAWSDAVCAQWPFPAVTEPRVIAAAGAAPILVVSTQHDPATPYEWGVRLAAELESAQLVSYNGDRHTAYRSGSECVDAAVGAYLVDGLVPLADPRCGY